MDKVISVDILRKGVKIVCEQHTFSVTRAFHRDYPLEEGQEFDWDEYEKQAILHQYPYALDYAVKLLAARAYATEELRQKIKAVGYWELTASLVIRKLQKNNLLDDSDFAVQWSQSRARSGMGKGRIAQELRRKGLSLEEAQAALESVDDESQLASAVKTASVYLRRAPKDEDKRKTLQRIMGALSRKGFDYGTSKKAVAMAAEDIANS